MLDRVGAPGRITSIVTLSPARSTSRKGQLSFRVALRRHPAPLSIPFRYRLQSAIWTLPENLTCRRQHLRFTNSVQCRCDNAASLRMLSHLAGMAEKELQGFRVSVLGDDLPGI